MQLSSAKVDRLVEEGLLASTRQWVPDQETYPRTIEMVRQEFHESRIAACPGEVILEPEFAEMLGREPGDLPVWFVTKPARYRVFFDEVIQQFGIALAVNDSDDSYVDLGMRTPDPIDAFLA